MPTVLIKNGYRFFFYSADDAEPIHIHVEYGDGVAKFWLNPIALAYAYNLKRGEIKRARILLENNLKLIEEKWHEYFGNDK